ncbi:Uma2 family endonuclease [Parathermosynechococcus lividus]
MNTPPPATRGGGVLIRRIYAEVGIPEYWVVNLQISELVVFRHPQGRHYSERHTLTEGTLQLLAFPEIAVAVSVLRTIGLMLSIINFD